MIPFKFNNVRFWIFIAVLTIGGAIYGNIASSLRESKLDEAQSGICTDTREVKHSSLIAIPNLKYQDEYIRAVTDTAVKVVNFQFVLVSEGQDVKILDYSIDSTLLKIAITRAKSTPVRPRYEELWIWEEFVTLNVNKD